MEESGKRPTLIPTPPSSAKPNSSARSSSINRRLKFTKSGDIPSDHDTSQTNRATENAEPLIRKTSFSKYDIIPPIKDKKNTNFEVTESDHDVREAIANNKGVQVKRTLYRKGDIFRRDKNAILENDRNSLSTSNQNFRPFRYPMEPDISEKDRISIAFRCPNGERFCRYFIPSDRLGDILVYLCDALNKGPVMNRLSLSTSEVPKRILVDLNAELCESGVENRMVLNVDIDDDSR